LCVSVQLKLRYWRSAKSVTALRPLPPDTCVRHLHFSPFLIWRAAFEKCLRIRSSERNNLTDSRETPPP
jgi:hypothetical protein